MLAALLLPPKASVGCQMGRPRGSLVDAACNRSTSCDYKPSHNILIKDGLLARCPQITNEPGLTKQPVFGMARQHSGLA